MTEARVCRLGVMLSGRGSNFASIQTAIEAGTLRNARIALVISNHADAPGLELARAKGLKTAAFDKAGFENRQAFDTAVTKTLKAEGVELLILAGYDRIISAPLLEAYAGHILNIHPSLLPAYGGKGMVGGKVHAAVLENGEAESGCSVHVVTDTVDGGPVLGQARVPVLPGDTPEALAARVLEQEHQLYPQAIGQFIEQQILPGEELKSHERNALV
ncbi:MAG TPA: phosphoribosylglycinamide formyltransferase [Coleofasciculaceae cyanobacterium]|jgi:phosphoribosylglycinamide formyltransferase-1